MEYNLSLVKNSFLRPFVKRLAEGSGGFTKDCRIEVTAEEYSEGSLLGSECFQLFPDLIFFACCQALDIDLGDVYDFATREGLEFCGGRTMMNKFFLSVSVSKTSHVVSK